MEIEPENPLDELGRTLTLFDLDEGILDHTEKLVEVIQMELKYLVLPELAKGQNPTLEWFNGFTYITISIHVEEGNRSSYSIEVRNLT
jgi:hypothetical protein